MKKIILSIAIILAIIVSACSQDVKSETFEVWGNCGVCKENIEAAVTSINGVTTAVWDKENRKITVSYDDKKITVKEIYKSITKSGYDISMINGDDDVYEDLFECCPR